MFGRGRAAAVGLRASGIAHDVGQGVAEVVTGVVAFEDEVGGGDRGEVEVGEGERGHRISSSGLIKLSGGRRFI